MTGPFGTEAEVRALPEVRAVYDAFDADPGVGKMGPPNQRMLYDALAAAGVYLGAYDHRIVEWLAGWEPQTVAVIAGWVQRASHAARADECEREEWCTAAATRTYVRTDWPHYGPGDERADVPFERVRTCDEHPMGDGQDGRPDYGWRLELPAEAVPGE